MRFASGIGVTNTTCPANHHRQSLCCKSGVEYEQYYIETEKDSNYRYTKLSKFYLKPRACTSSIIVLLNTDGFVTLTMMCM